MALADILRKGVEIANSVTASVQGDVIRRAWVSQTGDGTPTYADPVTIRAIIDQTRKRRFAIDGQLVTVVATLTVLDPMSPPLDVRDELVLPDGTTGPILEGPGSVYDPGTGRPFVNEIWIGEPNSNG